MTLTLNAGSGGQDLATEIVGSSTSEHMQVVKIGVGSSNTLDSVVSSAAPLPVTQSTVLDDLFAGQLADGHAVTVDNTTSSPVPITPSTGALPVADAGGSLTVDSTQLADIISGQLADGHNVTVDNTSAAPLPVEMTRRLVQEFSLLSISVTSSGDHVLVAASSNATTRVHGILLAADAPVGVTLDFGAFDTGVMRLGGLFAPPQERPLWETDTTVAVTLTLAAEQQVSGCLWYLTS